jgi:dynein heavy chain
MAEPEEQFSNLPIEITESQIAESQISETEGSKNEMEDENQQDEISQEEEIEEVEKPVVVDYTKLYHRFINAVALKDFNESMLSTDQKELIQDFLTTPEARKLVFYIDDTKENQLCVTTSLPPKPFEDMAYFIKEASSSTEIFTENEFERKVQFGKLTKNTMESLLNVMSHVYVPVFLGNKKWPDSVRKEFNNQLHKFMVNYIN